MQKLQQQAKKNNLLNVRKKEKRKSCILCYLLYVTFYFPGTLVYIQDVPPDTQPPRASPSNVNPVAAFIPFYKAPLFRPRPRGAKNRGRLPRGGKKKKKKKKLRNNESMLLQGEMWTDSSPCRTADVLQQGPSIII